MTTDEEIEILDLFCKIIRISKGYSEEFMNTFKILETENIKRRNIDREDKKRIINNLAELGGTDIVVDFMANE